MKVKILVVDDEVEIRDFLRRHLRYLGHQVEAAVDGEDALRKLADERFDLVISDISMPRLNGVNLLSRIRSDYPTVRVIMMTGYVSQESILACMRRGAEDCVFKPLEDLSEMESAVSRAVAKLERWWEILGSLRGMAQERTQIDSLVPAAGQRGGSGHG